jgi:hypothetical protein
MARSTETRTVILASDGRFVTLGRYSEPTAEELSAATAALAAQGVSAWLATMTGNPYTARRWTFENRGLLVRAGDGDFDGAVAAFQTAQKARNAAYVR